MHLPSLLVRVNTQSSTNVSLTEAASALQGAACVTNLLHGLCLYGEDMKHSEMPSVWFQAQGKLTINSE